MKGTFPTCAGVDVIEIGSAVCVGLRPFAAEGRTEAIKFSK